MKLVISSERCEGHGRCYALYPELFGSDEEGWGHVLTEDVDVTSLRKARDAVANCPGRAIELNEDPNGTPA